MLLASTIRKQVKAEFQAAADLEHACFAQMRENFRDEVRAEVKAEWEATMIAAQSLARANGQRDAELKAEAEKIFSLNEGKQITITISSK